jgi:hypothetical protein
MVDQTEYDNLRMHRNLLWREREDARVEVERLRALCGRAARHLRSLPAQSEHKDAILAEQLDAAAAGKHAEPGIDKVVLAIQAIGRSYTQLICEHVAPAILKFAAAYWSGQYRQAGAPYGDTDEARQRWIDEQTA